MAILTRLFAAAVTVALASAIGGALLVALLPPSLQTSKPIIYGLIGVALSLGVSAFQGGRLLVQRHPFSFRLPKALIFGIAALLLAFIGAAELYPRWQLHEALVTAAVGVRQRLPLTMDAYSTLVGVRVGFTEWTYVYRTSALVPRAYFTGRDEKARTEVCASGLRRWLRNGTSYRYEYRDPWSRRLLHKFEVASCP